MIPIRAGLAGAVFLLVALLPALALASYPPNSLSVTLTLAGLPDTIDLCRNPDDALLLNGIDEQWSLYIDTDGQGGPDVNLLVQTLQQSIPCTTSSAATGSALVASVYQKAGSLQDWANTGNPANISLDFDAHTLTVTTAMTGNLAYLTGQSTVNAFTSAGYGSVAMTPLFAHDVTPLANVGAALMASAGDVTSCSSPCSPGASYYPLIDIVGLSSIATSLLDAYAANTLTAEFDLAGLPDPIGLCAYPTLFTSSPGSEYFWEASFDLDNNINTGSGGADGKISVRSSNQAMGCSFQLVPIAQALTAEFDQWSDVQQNFVHVADLPVVANTLAGKLFVQADRTLPGLAGMSAQSRISEVTAGLYDPDYQGVREYAQDFSPWINLGQSYVAAADNVTNCYSDCSTTVNYYNQLDLVGGSVHLANILFHAGFD